MIKKGLIVFSIVFLIGLLPFISSSTVNVETFEYMKEKDFSAQKPVLGEEEFYINSLPAEKHPVTLYTDINIIKNRILREPYKTWYNQIKQTYDVNVDISKLTRFQKTTYAKALAFIYAVEKQEKYGDKARDLLLSSKSGDYDKDHFEDIDGLAYLSEAYDMLKGEGYNFEKENIKSCGYECNCKKFLFIKYSCKTCYACEKEIKNSLNDQIEQVAETNIIEATVQAGDSLTRKNNQHIRRYSAVALASLVLHNQKYFDNTMNGGTTFGLVGSVIDLGWKILTGIVSIFSRKTANDMKGVSMHYDGLGEVINYQIVNNGEGGWAEGPYYLRYSFNIAIPFMKTMNNANAQHDWLSVPKLRNTILYWAVNIAMPNGAMPPFDDSNMDASYSFTGYLDDEEGNWLWEKNYYSNTPPFTYNIDAICYYDDSIGNEVPDTDSVSYLPGAGQIIFRNNWSDDAVYLAFLGEYGKAVNGGFLHEHPDVMSFIMYAYGEYLALDSGYCDWENHDKVNKPENHNVVLSNGKLSSEGFGVDSDFFSTDYLDYGKISTKENYDRSILFVDKEYFLVFDMLNSKSNTNYEWILHGNGIEGTNTFNEYSMKGGAEWIQNNVGLLAYVVNGERDPVSFNKNVHCNSWQDIQQHTSMSVIKTGKNTGFLSLLYPSKGRSYPQINQENINGLDVLKINKADWSALSFINSNNTLSEVENIRTDASIFFMKKKSGDIEYLFADKVKKIYINNIKIFESENPTVIAIKFSGTDMEIKYKDNGNIELYENAESLIYNSETRNDLVNDGILSL